MQYRKALTAGWTAASTAARLPLLPSRLFNLPSLSSSPARCLRISAKGDDAEDGDDEEALAPGKALRVERLLANLGYGKRKDCQQLVQKGKAVRKDGKKMKVGDKVFHHDILLEGEELDFPFPVAVMVNKPVGYVVTAPDDDKILDPKVYDLLPYRFGRRRPFLSSVGRLDKATSGMLLLTDDGQLVHRINTPKKGIWKVYEAQLAAPMTDKEVEAATKRFASGEMILTGDFEPLLPAKLLMLGDDRMRVSICEGRYHQIRRMFTALGHDVLKLHRVSVGGLTMEGLPDGEWKYVSQADIDAVFSGPTAEEVLASQQLVVGHGASSDAVSEEQQHPGAEGEQELGDDEAAVLFNPASPVKKMEDEKNRRRKAALKLAASK